MGTEVIKICDCCGSSSERNPCCPGKSNEKIFYKIEIGIGLNDSDSKKLYKIICSNCIEVLKNELPELFPKRQKEFEKLGVIGNLIWEYFCLAFDNRRFAKTNNLTMIDKIIRSKE